MPDPTPSTKPSPWWKRFHENSNTSAVPDPWIRRKFVVLFVLALAVWALYVGIGRTFVPAIQQRDGAAFSRSVGIVLLVVFLILYIMFIWSYLAIIFTGPGFAKEFIPQTEDPAWKAAHYIPYHEPSTSDASWYAADGIREAPPTSSDLPDLYQDPQVAPPLPPPPAVPAGHDMPMMFSGGPTRESHAVDLLSFGGRSSHATAVFPSTAPQSVRPAVSTLTHSQPSSSTPMLHAPRIPRPTPPVSFGPRWCQHCKIVKPDRTHHCRHCGTCVLQFDHHCVWVGQCVGWRNHAVFLTFCFWAGVFCLFSTAVLVLDCCLALEVDGQKIALITIAGLLFMFTLLMMLPTHIYLILVGRSTFESFQTGTQQRAEEAALKLEFKNPVCPTKDVRTVRKGWNEEYGGVAVNDRWRVGRKRDRWRQEMGKSPVGWVLPVGRPLGDGIHYEQNPRFGPNGEWLPMRDWPPGVERK